MRLKRAIAVAVVAAVAVGASVPTASGFRDRDCSDFDNRKQAQKFFKKAGGPRDDPHGLDADNDGKACESVPKN